MVRIEMGDGDFLEQRLKQVRQEFAEQLLLSENKREAVFIPLIEDLFLKALSPRDLSMRKRLEEFKNQATVEEQDSELVNYNRWLEKKLG
jgi:hypothetical protein